MTFSSHTIVKISRPGVVYGPAPIRPDAKPIWSVPISGKEFDNSVVFGGGLAIIHRNYNEVLGVDPATGQTVWSLPDPLVADIKPKDLSSIFAPQLYSAEGVVKIRGSSRLLPGSSASHNPPLAVVWLDAATGEVLQGPEPDEDAYYKPVFAEVQWGDWIENSQLGTWWNHKTGETSEACPRDLTLLDRTDPKGRAFKWSIYERRSFVAGHHVFWAGEADEEGFRRLVCIDLPSGQERWATDIQTRVPGSRQEMDRVFLLRHAVVLSCDHSVHGPYLAFDPKTGRPTMRGRSFHWSGCHFCSTGRLLDPPSDALDLLLIGEQEQDAVSAYDPRSGERVWSTLGALESNVKRRSSDRPDHMVCLARSHNTLWLRHISCRTVHSTSKKDMWVGGKHYPPGKKFPKAKSSAALVALDHNTGELLATRKIPERTQYAGQDGGRLYLREGRKIVCYA